jgi:hypothetical protein
MLMSLDMYDSPIDMSELAKVYGVTLTTLDDFVHDFVAANAPTCR